MASLLSIDAASSRELRDLITALARAEREVAKEVRQQSRAVIVPEWKKGLAEHATSRLEVRAISQTGRALVSDRNVQLTAGSTKAGFKRYDPRRYVDGIEFGANRESYSTYSRRSQNGGSHQVKRRTKRHLKRPRRGGYVAYPTASDLIPRIASLWVSTAVRAIHELLERR